MTFDRAWQTYAGEDANRRAPVGLEARVLRALATPVARPARRRGYAAAGLAIAASLAVSASWPIARSMARPEKATAIPEILQSRSTPPAVSYLAAATREAPAIAAAATKRPGTAARSPSLPPRVRTSGGTEPEALQLVRLRLPRQALAALGVILIDPDAAGVVQVDVLVGEDGLLRDIRKVWFEP